MFYTFLEVVKVYKDKIESSNERFHEILSEEKNEKLLEKMEKQVRFIEEKKEEELNFNFN
jgi:hypothetical protein